MINVPSHTILKRGLNIPIPCSHFKMMLSLKACVLCSPGSTQQPEGFSSDLKLRESMLGGVLHSRVFTVCQIHKPPLRCRQNEALLQLTPRASSQSRGQASCDKTQGLKIKVVSITISLPHSKDIPECKMPPSPQEVTLS